MNLHLILTPLLVARSVYASVMWKIPEKKGITEGEGFSLAYALLAPLQSPERRSRPHFIRITAPNQIGHICKQRSGSNSVRL